VTKPVDKDSLPLDKPRRTPGHPTKSHVVKTKVDGREKIIRFGEQGAETAGKPKAGESDRMKQKRASFKARHAKNIAKGKSSPAYWANKVKWADGGAVKMAAGGAMRMPRAEGAALQLIEQMRRAGGQEEFNPVLASLRDQRQASRRSQTPLQARQAPRAATPAAPAQDALPLPPVPPAMRPDENPPPEASANPMRFDEGNPHVATAISMAQRYNLPPSVFLSLVQQESRFDPNARSPRGAIGLGQLMPGTARELGVDPRDPVQNLEGSARYLRQMLDRFGSMELALAAYNAGPGTVRRAGNTIPNIRETQNYVPSILRRAGASVPEPSLTDLDQKYAEGGRVGRIAGAIGRAVRGRREPETPPMVAMHNTRPERLERMAEREGVAVAPSIAISRADDPTTSFGDVSLMVSPETINPSRTPVYPRDAYTPRYPNVETRNVRGEDREVIRVMNENTGEWRSLPHTPENALRVMRREPWRGGEDFITDNWLLAQLAPQFRNMSELRAARSRLVPASDTAVADWTKGLDDLRSEWSRVLSESGYPADWRFADSLQRNLAEAANRRDGMSYINRTYYNNAIPEDLLARTQAHLDAGRDLPSTYFEAKPRRLVPLNEFEGAVVPLQAPQDLTDLLRRYGIEDIRYYTNPEQRAEQVRRFERLLFGGAPVAAGAAMAAEGAEPEPEGYAEGGEVRTPEEEEYDRRLLSRMKAQTGRVTEPTRAEQMQALRTAGSDIASTAADILLPQSPLDLALMAAFGPGGRAARLMGSTALASLEPSEAEASRLRRLIRAYHGSPHKFDEFDIRKIGAGEGAQAYGRGLYFAENEDIAKHYRDSLSGKVNPYTWRALNPDDAWVNAARSMWDTHSPEEIGSILRSSYRNPPISDEQLDIVMRAANPGHMYEVDLNAAPRDFLNWDEPLSRQSREVQESLQRFGLRADPDAARAYDDALLDSLYNDPAGSLRTLPPEPRDPTGADIYQRVLRMDPEEARIALMQAGIPGTRYLDAGSRGVGGTYNYAVFDPEIIDIQRRYAQGGLAELDQKYAEGGIVAAEPAKYDPDAVDALVKQIEAEYV
jgi:soluble lytic murein transglycosylase-like protein